MPRQPRGAIPACGPATAGAAPARTPPDDDPYAWLEDVLGARSLEWVRAHNARAEAGIAGSARFKALEAQIRAILDSDARIPTVEKIGAYYYNFWKDRRHERGIWRRTTPQEYRKADPAWETVLDLDALNAAEGASWVWHGASALRPKFERCLIALSPGGCDADVTREFDLVAKRFVVDGFQRPVAKGNLAWIDRDTVYAFTDFGAGSLTRSGYPRVVKEWKRGTPLSAAEVVFEGEADDMMVSARHDPTPGFERDWVTRTLAFYDDELHLRGRDGGLTRIDLPNSMRKLPHREWLFLEPREDWTVGGTRYPAGSLLVARLDDFIAGKREPTVLFAPTARTSLHDFTPTRDHVVVHVIEDVKSRLFVAGPGENGWTRSDFAGAPAIGSAGVVAVDPVDSDAVWLTTADFLTPAALSIAEVGRAPQRLKSDPVLFDAGGHVVEQHFATSNDGTAVPYFLVRPKDLAFDGEAPALLYGYGGFEISLTPAYSGTVGKAWLEKGGVYVLANIRGGGEYGPRWHQAALEAGRHRAYEDFAAIADDLVARRITSPRHLGAMGGSNGGLLMGNMLTRFAEKFGAIVAQVPLLDMKRYHRLLAGASWMAEYGDPDSDDWTFIRTFSPYHRFDPDRPCPPVLFTTSTQDDRVHPGHARKMAAKMEAAGKDVHYWENVEGGHGGSADNAQAAHMSALAYAFLWDRLAK